MLDYRINTFLVLCDMMNYRKTGEKLNMTQPSVTQHIQYLERYYGCRLFIYKGKKLKKTKQAEVLESYARSEKYNDLQVKEELQSKKKRKLRMGATKTIGDYILCDQLANLLNDSDFELTLIVDNTKALLNQLDHQQLDLIVVEGIFDKKKYSYQHYRQEAFVGVCSIDHPFAGKEISMTSIFHEHLIIREAGSGTRDIFEKMLQTDSYDLSNFQAKTCLSSFKMIEAMIISGGCITFAYESFVNSNSKMTSFKLKGLNYLRKLNYVYLKKADVSNWLDLLKEKII